MTNKQLIDSIRQKTGFSARKVEYMLKAYVRTFDSFLDEGFSVTMNKFGTFEPTQKAERKVYNPRTGQYKTVPTKMTVKFKPSTTLKNTFKG